MDNVKRQWAFIINPVAGNGSAKTIVPRLEEMIRKKNINAELSYTERTGHATELSAKYLGKGYSYIIGVGGDGTFNEIAKPLINKKIFLPDLSRQEQEMILYRSLVFLTGLEKKSGMCFLIPI